MKCVKITILLFLLGISSAVFSQVNLGIKFGSNYNFNGFSSDSLNLHLDNAVSFSGGGLVRLKVKKVHLQVEGLFVARKGSVSNGNSSGKFNFYSFDMPILIGYKLIDLKVVKVRLNGGIIPSFHIASLGDLQNVNYKDSFYSAAGGISVDIPLFLFDVRYQGAIGDYYQVQNSNSSTTLSNSLLTLSVAWKII